MAKKARKPVKKGSARKKSLSRSSKKSSSVRIQKGMSVSEVLQVHPETLAVFASHDLLCLGDSSQQAMTIRDWALDHGLDVSRFLSRLNTASSKRHKLSRNGHAHKGL